MAALKGALALVLLLAAATARPENMARWRPFIAEASARFGVPQGWIEAVMRAESGGRTRLHGRPITSRAGAMGLMQVMPATWRDLARAHGLGPDPHDPRDNILAGTAYLRAMYDRFGHPGLFGAYNAGPGRYAEHLATGRPLPAETRAYLAAVTQGRAARSIAATIPAPPMAGEGTAARLFFPLRAARDGDVAAPEQPRSDIFMVRPTGHEESD